MNFSVKPAVYRVALTGRTDLYRLRWLALSAASLMLKH